MTQTFQHFGIIGAGAWGTALGVALRHAGRDVLIWAREGDLVDRMNKHHENDVYLKGIRLDDAIRATATLADVEVCNALILACPAQFVQPMCVALGPVAQGKPLIIVAKGVDKAKHKLLSEIIAKELPDNPLYILSGPSFAREVAQHQPTALTLAGETDGADLAQAMVSASLRIYTTDDVIGTQIGGAVKNVLAIACGIVVGRGLGDNARAALITRGLAEIMRLAVALGARTETIVGLSGLGDTVLTCSSPQSRNMSLGIALGQGKSLEHALAQSAGVAEGIDTAAAVWALARHHGVDMPVVGAVDRILRDHAAIDVVISELLTRPLRAEAA